MITITTLTPGDGLRRVDGIAHGLRHSSSKFYTFVLRSTVSWLRDMVRVRVNPSSNRISGVFEEIRNMVNDSITYHIKGMYAS